MSNIPSSILPHICVSAITLGSSSDSRGLSISTANWRFHVMHMKPSILQSYKLTLLSEDWDDCTLLSLFKSYICTHDMQPLLQSPKKQERDYRGQASPSIFTQEKVRHCIFGNTHARADATDGTWKRMSNGALRGRTGRRGSRFTVQSHAFSQG